MVLPVIDSALIDAETIVPVQGHRQWAMFDQSLLQLPDRRQLIRFLFIDVPPGKRSIKGCPDLIAVARQAIARAWSFKRQHELYASFDFSHAQDVCAT